MKKKSLIFLAIALIFPLFAFIGCTPVNSYKIQVFQSCSNGTINGAGTYNEGDTVTLTASALGDNYFIAWIYQNKTIIKNNDIYNITNETKNELVSKSTLTFSASMSTSDKYTAVFSDKNQLYYNLSSYRLTTDLEKPESEDSEILFDGVLTVQFGEDMNSFREALKEETSFVNSNNISVESNQTILLSLSSDYYVKFRMEITGTNPTQFEKIVTLKYANSETTNGVNVNFNNKVLTLTYEFNLTNDETPYYLILTLNHLA